MSLTRTRICLCAAVVLLLLAQACLAADPDRSVAYTGDIVSLAQPTNLSAKVTSSDGAVSAVPVGFDLSNLFGWSRHFGPVLTNGLGQAGAPTILASDVYRVDTTATFPNDPAEVKAIARVLTVAPPNLPPGANEGIVAGGLFDAGNALRDPCDPERKVSFGLLYFRGDRPYSYTGRFMLIDPNGPVWPTCQLDPVCQEVVIEAKLFESVELDCCCKEVFDALSTDSYLQQCDLPCVVTIRGKAAVNGKSGFPFVLTVSRCGRRITLDLVVTNPADVNFQPIYKIRIAGKAWDDGQYLITCLPCTPDASRAYGSVRTYSGTPDGRRVRVNVMGVTDCKGRKADITIDGITQDEPTDCCAANDQCPDAGGVGTSTAQVRAERCDTGDGRVYEISFTATSVCDGSTSTGKIRVCIPLRGQCVDSGQNYDSTSTAGCVPPPDCSGAVASPSTLTTVNGQLAGIQITGITGCNGSPVTIAVTGVTQDEPTDCLSSNDQCPDAEVSGNGTVKVRAERSNSGNGRVYRISFTATCCSKSCQGSVTVCVPRTGSTCVDSGQNYNSLDTSPCMPGPDCSTATPSLTQLTGTPDHSLVNVSIQGVAGCNGNPATIEITQVRQDEPIAGCTTGDVCPDAVINANGTVDLRRERCDGSDGRIYRITFTATGCCGKKCQGNVQVCVPSATGQCIRTGTGNITSTGTCP